MKRRLLLASGCGAALVGIAGCLAMSQGDKDANPDENTSSIDGCHEDVDWSEYHADSPTDPDPSSIAGRRNCENADRPEPSGDLCTTHEIGSGNETETVPSAGIRLYPNPPSSFDEDSITEFVYEYERAFEHNREVEDHGKAVTSPEITIEEEFTITKQTKNNIYIVRIQYWPPSGVYEHKGQSIDRDVVAVIYGVDRTGVVRTSAETIYEYHDSVLEESPDPVKKGTLLECF